VLGKVSATLPSRLQQNLLHAVSRVHRFDRRFPEMLDMPVVREACWHEEALSIGYADRKGAVSTRTIWPLSIVYLDRSIFVLAWCCLREDFRMFRADRLRRVVATGKSFRPRRARLLREYLTQFEGREQSQEDAEE
jgi:predicted DNA-binding transcriptional regulator YafY